MGKYKICVYAICKNEEKFAKRWYESVKDADYVTVLDTGSTDRSVEILKQLGADVKCESFKNFRFDEARNLSLKFIPSDTDICICIDLDEILSENWREALEKQWDKNTTRAKYRYVWNYLEDGSEGHVFYADKIHSFKNYCWKNPVHEVLSFSGEFENVITLKEFEIYHKADDSKSRSQYLPLLELAVKENPLNDRNMHYLGREYMFNKRWADAIYTLKKHISLPTALWKDERCSSMIYISRCYTQLNEHQKAMCWLYKAIAEAEHLREPLCEMASLLYKQSDWHGVIFFSKQALKIKNRTESYITSPMAWGSYLYDILSIAYYNTGDLTAAKEYALAAYQFSKSERIKKNIELFDKIKKTK